MVYKYDFLIIGSGIAGMSYALKVAKVRINLNIRIINKLFLLILQSKVIKQ